METTPGLVPRNCAADLAIGFLADENRELRERNGSLEQDTIVLKDIAEESLGQLHRLTVQTARLEGRMRDLVEALRVVRQENAVLRGQLRAKEEAGA